MYNEEGELVGDGRRLVDQLDAASEALRCACHLLTWMDTAELEPAHWARVVATMHELTGRVEQVLGHVGKRYSRMEGAYPGGIAADNGTDAAHLAATISVLAMSARDKISTATEQLIAAHNKGARLLAPTKED